MSPSGLSHYYEFSRCRWDMMIGSGIEELLEPIYATNSVGHMMSGKAFARAIRGHFLDDSCLNNILIDKIVKE